MVAVLPCFLSHRTHKLDALGRNTLKLGTKSKLAILIAIVALLLFIVPIVPKSNIHLCPDSGYCSAYSFYNTATVSAVYYALGVGGRVIGSSYEIIVWPAWICHNIPNGVECWQPGWYVS
jgi:hypothetical protein